MYLFNLLKGRGANPAAFLFSPRQKGAFLFFVRKLHAAAELRGGAAHRGAAEAAKKSARSRAPVLVLRTRDSAAAREQFFKFFLFAIDISGKIV